MTFETHFKAADDVLAHIDQVLPGLNNPFLEARYAGFFAVAAVTVLELAMKQVFEDFAQREHPVLASFCNAYFERVNGRISVKDIREQHARKFGEKYVDRFSELVDEQERRDLRAGKGSLKSAYGNLLTARHKFVHEGQLPSNTSYAEVRNGYAAGKEIMTRLARAMDE